MRRGQLASLLAVILTAGHVIAGGFAFWAVGPSFAALVLPVLGVSATAGFQFIRRHPAQFATAFGPRVNAYYAGVTIVLAAGLVLALIAVSYLTGIRRMPVDNAIWIVSAIEALAAASIGGIASDLFEDVKDTEAEPS